MLLIIATSRTRVLFVLPHSLSLFHEVKQNSTAEEEEEEETAQNLFKHGPIGIPSLPLLLLAPHVRYRPPRQSTFAIEIVNILHGM